MKVKQRIAILGLVILVILAAVVTAVSYTSTRNSTQKIVDSILDSGLDTLGSQAEYSASLEKIVTEEFNFKNITLAYAFRDFVSIGLNNGTLDYDDTYAFQAIADTLQMTEVNVTDSNGVIIGSNYIDNYGFGYAGSESTAKYLQIIEDPSAVIVEEPRASAVSGEMYQYMGVALPDNGGFVQVGLAADVVKTFLDNLDVANIAQGMKIGSTGHAVVISGGMITYSPDSAKIGTDVSGTEWFTKVSGGRGKVWVDIDGERMYAGYDNANGMTMLALFPESEYDGYITPIRNTSIIIALILIAMIAVVSIILKINFDRQFWYESILDNIPLPLSVTDNDRNWTFINRPVEQMLGIKRDEVIGKQCSNWGAGICNTPNCGINCLEHGKFTTTFNQLNMDFKVDVAYLTDAKGRHAGHIEVVQNITDMVAMQNKIISVAEEIENMSGTFVASSRQIADGAGLLADGSTRQAATIQQISASVTDISRKTIENAKRTQKAAELSEVIMSNAEKGNRQMGQMISAVDEINAANQNISKVIKAIDDIAFQTNILALNAAVEAARAGQAGRGFAVVAEEVRNLAAKSAESAKETGALIANSIEKASLGTHIAHDTANSLSEIVTGINQSNAVIAEIARSSEEQTDAVSQINTAISGIAEVVQQNSATAEQSSAASQEMSGQVNLLETLIAKFKQ